MRHAAWGVDVGGLFAAEVVRHMRRRAWRMCGWALVGFLTAHVFVHMCRIARARFRRPLIKLYGPLQSLTLKNTHRMAAFFDASVVAVTDALR